MSKNVYLPMPESYKNDSGVRTRSVPQFNYFFIGPNSNLSRNLLQICQKLVHRQTHIQTVIIIPPQLYWQS